MYFRRSMQKPVPAITQNFRFTILRQSCMVIGLHSLRVYIGQSCCVGKYHSTVHGARVALAN